MIPISSHKKREYAWLPFMNSNNNVTLLIPRIFRFALFRKLEIDLFNPSHDQKASIEVFEPIFLLPECKYCHRLLLNWIAKQGMSQEFEVLFILRVHRI